MNEGKLIGARLVELRNAKGISQRELANRMGYKSDATISKWEAGTNVPNGGKLAKLAQILDTTTDYILFGGGRVIVDNNHGMAGDNHGMVTINNGRDQTDKDHNATMQELAVLDGDIQAHLLKLLTQQVALMYEKTELQKSIDKRLATLIEIGEEVLDEIKSLRNKKEN